MHPVITTLRIGEVSLPIASYGVLLALALCVGALGTLRAAVRRGMELGVVVSALGIAIGSGFAGALIVHALAQLARAESFAAVLEAPSVLLGISVLGALGFGALAVVRSAPSLGLSAGALLDAAVPSVALAQALGRIGCWLGGCCYGSESHGPLSLSSRHPWPLYEAAALLALAGWFALDETRSRNRPTGTRAASYLIAYGVIRLALEPLRGDAVRGLFFENAISTAQLVAVVVIGAALAFRVRAAKQALGAGLAITALVASVTGAAWLCRVPRAAAERFEKAVRTRAPIARIEAGTFMMGSDDADIAFAIALCKASELLADQPCDVEAFSIEHPAHLVQLPAFAIDRREVSNADYRRCAQSGVCAQGRVMESDARLGQAAQPVVMVTALEAEKYCAFAGGRLPSEAEWERAARAGSTRRFPWGNAWNTRLASYGPVPGSDQEEPADGYRASAPVGSFEDGANALGMLDMAGNVWELTADAFEPGAYAARAGHARVVAPVVLGAGSRVIRGGSYATPPVLLRTTQRARIADSEPRPDVGFRCAYTPASKE